MTARAAGLFFFASACAAAEASPAACAACHRAETSRFSGAAMTRALAAGKDSPILRDHPQLAARIGPYSYEIAGPQLTVTDGRESLSVPLEWAFGTGAVGQTFLFRREGRWYESRASYYSAPAGLDITIGQQSITPANLLEAAGRLLPPAEVDKCFDCHATNVVKSPTLKLSAMTAGVQCERCHGSAEAHLRGGAAMKKLGALGAEEMSELCGQCHRTWSQVAAGGPRGIQNIRFQPYRLGTSKCYDTADRRIRCTACHDPHRDVETSATAYDAKCTACHSGAARATRASAAICKVAAKNCVTCHMPKVELPGAHSRFTDHRIRIVKSGEAYPD